jgi:hypothetical protein
MGSIFPNNIFVKGALAPNKNAAKSAIKAG